MNPGSEAESAAADRVCEIAAVLFTDIVSYSTQPMDEQSALLTTLQQIVKNSTEFQQAKARKGVVSLPTGDGMALVFFGDPVAPVRCAVQIAEALRAHPDVKLRMGIHGGPVFRHADIKDELNVVGGGINMAQRVMDCGGAGHILVSQNVADTLLQLSAWRDWVHDLGMFEVKHGVKLHIYNFYKDGVGNTMAPHKPAATAAPVARKAWWKPLAALAAALIVAVALWIKLHPAEPPKAPVPERILNYHLIVQKYREQRQNDWKPYGDPFPLETPNINFEPGYEATLIFQSPEVGHLYILNELPDSYYTLFPTPKANQGSSLIDAGKEVATHPMYFNEERGTEKLWLVWTRQNAPELEPLQRWINDKDRGRINDPVEVKTVRSFLEQHRQPEPVVTVDGEHHRTRIAGRSENLVCLLKLLHQ